MISISVTISENNMRIDRFLTLHYPEYTRSFLKKLIISGKIGQNGAPITKASQTVHTNDTITIETFDLPKRTVQADSFPDYCAQHLLFEHEHFLIINKIAGLITHQPEHSSAEPTLADILVTQRPEIACVGQEGRHGIVHRLDKDTSGLLIIAKTNYGYEQLISLFKNREIKKTYYALVNGHPPSQGSITMPLKRHPSDPRKIITCTLDGRSAHTDYEALQYFDDYTLIKAYPLTGRTHQIRVHLAAIGYPVLGDGLYGSSSKKIKRQALHAHKIEFVLDGQQFSFECPLPEDIQRLL